MDKIRVLVVDDSVVFRSQIRSCLESSARIEVIGVAANGKIALEKMRNSHVDLVTLDLEMPEMNGIETLQELRRLGLKSKVIVFSSASQRGARATLDALELGAVDFVQKPNGENEKSAESISSVDLLKNLLIPRIESLFFDSSLSQVSTEKTSSFQWKNFTPEAIVIGCSTGGPTALETIFSALKGPFRCPIFIAQHMPPIFTASLAGRLGKLCGVEAAEGVHDEVIMENRIYVAPGNFHMQIVMKSGQLRISLNQQEQENSVRPAVDQLFRSAAEVYSKSCLGYVLTGMGQDGLKGAQALRERGNPVVIQNRESCVVFGMPGALFQASAYDSIQNLEQITESFRGYAQLDPLLRRGAS